MTLRAKYSSAESGCTSDLGFVEDTFCDFGVGAHADIRTWREQRCVDAIPNKTVQPSEQLGLIPEMASLRESRRSEPEECRPRPGTPGSE